MEIRVPAKPEIEKKQDKGEDLRKYAVVPFGAVSDRSINPFSFRVLAALAGYANRAGVTYVGQRELARLLKTTQPRICNALTALKRAGWIKQIGKPVQGIRGATLQVMYAPDMTVQDAVAIASAKTDEDLRPPEQREQELAEMIADNEKEWTAAELAANKERLAKMLIEAFNTPKDSTKAYTESKNDSIAVKKIKQEIRSRMRQIRKQEYDDNEAISKTEYNHNNICLDTQNSIVDMPETDITLSNAVYEQRDALTYQGIVEIVSNELMNGVKTESDMQGCAWLAEIGCTADMLNLYITRHPGDTAYDIAKRIINGA